MIRYAKIIAAITGTAAVLALAPVWFGWDMPPWAKAEDLREVNSTIEDLASAEDLRALNSAVEELAVQVAGNTEAGWLRQLENAFARKDWKDVRRICNIISKLYGYKAADCP